MVGLLQEMRQEETEYESNHIQFIVQIYHYVTSTVLSQTKFYLDNVAIEFCSDGI